MSQKAAAKVAQKKWLELPIHEVPALLLFCESFVKVDISPIKISVASPMTGAAFCTAFWVKLTFAGAIGSGSGSFLLADCAKEDGGGAGAVVTIDCRTSVHEFTT